MDEKIPRDTGDDENMKRLAAMEELSVSSENESSSSFFGGSSDDSTEEEENVHQVQNRETHADGALSVKRGVKSQHYVSDPKSSTADLRSNNAAKGNSLVTSANIWGPQPTVKFHDPSLYLRDVKPLSAEMNSLNVKEKTDLPLHLRLGKEPNLVRHNVFSVPYSSTEFRKESSTSPKSNAASGFSVNSEEYGREFPRLGKESVNYETRKKFEFGKQYGILTLQPNNYGLTFPHFESQEEQTSSSSDPDEDEDSKDFERYMKEIEKYNPLLPDPDNIPLELPDTAEREKNVENVEGIRWGKMVYSDAVLQENKESETLFYDCMPKQAMQDHSSVNVSGHNSPSTSQTSSCQWSPDKLHLLSILFNDDIPLPPEFNFLYSKGENERLPLYLRGKKELNATEGDTFSASSLASEYETEDFRIPLNPTVSEFPIDSDKCKSEFSKPPQAVVSHSSPPFPREVGSVPVESKDTDRNSEEYGRQYLDRASPKFSYKNMYCTQQLENSGIFHPFPNIYTRLDSSTTNSEKDDNTDSCFSTSENDNVDSGLRDCQKISADESCRNITPLGTEEPSLLHFENYGRIPDLDGNTLRDVSTHNYASPSMEMECKPFNSEKSCSHDKSSSTSHFVLPSSCSSPSPNLLQSKRWKNEECEQPLVYDPESTYECLFPYLEPEDEDCGLCHLTRQASQQ